MICPETIEQIFQNERKLQPCLFSKTVPGLVALPFGHPCYFHKPSESLDDKCYTLAKTTQELGNSAKSEIPESFKAGLFQVCV